MLIKIKVFLKIESFSVFFKLCSASFEQFFCGCFGVKLLHLFLGITWYLDQETVKSLFHMRVKLLPITINLTNNHSLESKDNPVRKHLNII